MEAIAPDKSEILFREFWEIVYLVQLIMLSIFFPQNVDKSDSNQVYETPKERNTGAQRHEVTNKGLVIVYIETAMENLVPETCAFTSV